MIFDESETNHTPLHIASDLITIRTTEMQTRVVFSELPVVKIIKSHIINDVFKKGSTPLHHAAES